MTNEEILKKAIEKAFINGYRGIIECKYFIKEGSEGEIKVGDLKEFSKLKTPIPYKVIIFSHDFAKAFFGTDKYSYWLDGEYMSNEETEEDYKEALKKGSDWQTWMPNWQFHLQQMVVQENPLKYLEQFLDK